MKYQRFAALVLAAALLLTGCGGTQSSPSAAADQSSDSSRSTPGAVAQAAQTDRITDQYTLEKNVSGVWGEDAVQYISVHVPQLECDSPDAACINEELSAIYAADFREFEAYEEAGQPDGDAPLIGVGWDDWWYGDCVSLVVRSRYGGTAPWRYSGWCFDFATGQQITVAELLQRMGLDPDTVQHGWPCRPLTGRWRRARITRACVSAESSRKCGWIRWNTMSWKTCACFCRSRINWCSGESTAAKKAGSSWIWSSRCPPLTPRC